MTRQHYYILLSVLSLVLSSLACRVEISTPTPTTPDNTPAASVIATATYLPTIPVTIWTHTPAPSGSGKAQP